MGKWIIALFFVLGLIIATNLIDKRNFHQVADAIETIYEDRLVAKDLIFKMSSLMHEKSIAFASSDSSFYDQRIHKVNQEVEELIALFAETRLTKEERLAFEQLQSDISVLASLEQKGLASSEGKHQLLSDASVTSRIERILVDLRLLSKIQIEEGKQQVLIGKEAVSSIDFLTQMEIYILVIIGILVQVLLISGFRYRKIRQRGNTGQWLDN
ncbi:MAG: MCP four helix bundle domain-containing protein [Cryomorphaceae bacterium]